MGKTDNKRVWCITYYGNLESTPREAFRRATCEDGTSVEIGIGPAEFDERGPHHHCLLRCLSRPITKSRAKAYWNELQPNAPLSETDYFKSLLTTTYQYVNYMYKSYAKLKKSRLTLAIEEAVEAITKEQGYSDASDRLKAHLFDQEGFDFVTKYKKDIEEAKKFPSLMQEKRTMDIQNDDDENASKTFQIINYFKQNLKNQYTEKQPAPYTGEFEHLSSNQQVNYILMITLLPILVNRAFEDGIPGIIFYGIAHTGKSYFFSKCKYFKKVASDAKGVSRFKLNSNESAYLFDDSYNDYLIRKDNESTIKQLTLGQETSIKIHSNSQLVRAFVFITMNEKPFFLTVDPSLLQAMHNDSNSNSTTEANGLNINNIKAWRRRFITFHMTEPCEATNDTKTLNFERSVTRMVVRHIWLQLYEECTSDIQTKFDEYYKFIQEMPMSSKITTIIEEASAKQHTIEHTSKDTSTFEERWFKRKHEENQNTNDTTEDTKICIKKKKTLFNIPIESSNES